MKVTVKGVFQIELVDWGIGFDNILLMHIAIFLVIVRWLVNYLTLSHLQFKKNIGNYKINIRYTFVNDNLLQSSSCLFVDSLQSSEYSLDECIFITKLL